MQNVLPLVRASLVTLSLVELASVLTRLRHRDARREAAWMGILLAAFTARLLVPRGTAGDILLPAAVVTATVNLLLAMSQRRGALAWTLAASGVAALLAALDLFGPELPGRGRLLAAAVALLSVPPLVLLVGLQRKTGDPADAVLIALSAAWDAACCVEIAGLAPAGVSDLLMAPLLLLIGFMLFEQGYLSPLTSSGYVDRLARQRRLMRQTYARLLDSSHALVLQDRLIAAGLLALGAAHEFRDVLAAVRATAEHGRASRLPGDKDACLELVVEHAASGGSSAVEFLERLGREGREKPCGLDVRECIDRLVRIARPAWRPAGICLVTDGEPGLRVLGRPREIEQIVLNLLRNAVEAFADDHSDVREITVRCWRSGPAVSVSVSDTAGGILPAMANELFSLGRSGSGSTGIGLYLARNLASRNGGSLSYEAIPGGSRFTLVLPAEDVSPAPCHT